MIGSSYSFRTMSSLLSSFSVLKPGRRVVMPDHWRMWHRVCFAGCKSMRVETNWGDWAGMISERSRGGWVADCQSIRSRRSSRPCTFTWKVMMSSFRTLMRCDLSPSHEETDSEPPRRLRQDAHVIVRLVSLPTCPLEGGDRNEPSDLDFTFGKTKFHCILTISNTR